MIKAMSKCKKVILEKYKDFNKQKIMCYSYLNGSCSMFMHKINEFEKFSSKK